SRFGRPPCSTLFPYTTLFRSVGARAHPAVLGGALEVRAGGGRVALSKREDPKELLRSTELLATGGDPPQMRRGLTRRLLGDIKRSEEHTSELQSRGHLVCRLL